MELSLLIFKDLLSKFLIAAAGFIAVKAKISKTGDNKAIAVLLVYFFAPCAMLGTFSVEYESSLLAKFGITAGITLIVLALFAIIGRILNKSIGLDEPSQACMIFTNNGSFIISVISLLLGSEAVFYLSAFITVHVIFFWTYGYKLLSGQDGIKLKNLINPNIIAVLVGFALFVTRIELPEIVSSAITSMGSMNSSMAMFLIGMSLGMCNFKSVFAQKKVWLLSIGRMIMMPAIVVIILALTGVAERFPELATPLLVVVIAASCPMANNVLEVTLINPDTDENAIERSASVSTLTTLMCIVTIPVMIMLYQALC